MNLCLRLLVVCSLLWKQIPVATGQNGNTTSPDPVLESKTTTTTSVPMNESILAHNSVAVTSPLTPSNISPIISNTDPVLDSHTTTAISVPINKSILAYNSVAVTAPLTPTNNSPIISNTDPVLDSHTTTAISVPINKSILAYNSVAVTAPLTPTNNSPIISNTDPVLDSHTTTTISVPINKSILAYNSVAVTAPLTPTNNSPIISNTDPVLDSHTTTTISVPINKSILAYNSVAVTAPLTPTNNSPFISNTGVSLSTTQAPSLTTEQPTSSLTSDAAVTPSLTNDIHGNSTTGSSNSSDFHSTIAPTISDFNTTTPRGPKTDGIDCSGINSSVTHNHNDGNVTLTLADIPDSLNLSPFACDGYALKLISRFVYTFQVRQCELRNITCHFKECISPIPVALNIKLDADQFELNHTVNDISVAFKWTSKKPLFNCNVSGIFTCTGGNPAISGISPVKSLEGEVKGLHPYTDYNCTGKLKYQNKSIKNESITIKTKIGTPGKIIGLECTHRNMTSITIEWKRPHVINGPLSEYKVKIEGRDGIRETHVDLGNTLTYTFKNLNIYQSYEVEVSAFNIEKGIRLEGDHAHQACMTAEGEPGKVRDVSATFERNNIIIIRCDKPEHIHGPKSIFNLTFSGQSHDNKSCYFRMENLNYLTSYDYELSFYNGAYNGEPSKHQITTRYNDKALIGFLVFLIIVTSVALLLVLFKIYKLQKRTSSQCENSFLLVNQDDERQLLNIEPIPVEQLLETYKRKNADEGRLFLDEFQSIPRIFSKFSIKEARKSHNQSKNRYIDILPYDDNRVVLSEIQGELGSDYINASYINGFKEPRKYIAAQGPKEETVNDFWRMIWEQKTTIIVMVTRCEEGNRNKCAQYWPSMEEETEIFGDIVVKIKEEKNFPDYITRKLHIMNRREKTERDVTHIQFTVWPDHGVPDDSNLLLRLRRRVNALSNFFSGPIIVHCSAGVGRTGTYISIDAMIEGLESEGRVDVYGYVVQLRRQRCLMVQVESQYIFIHKALVEYNQFGETEVSILELPLLLNNLKKHDPPSEPSQLECEFQRLPSYRNWRPQNSGNHHENKDKNRNPNVIPYEYNRVQIKLEEEQSGEAEEDSYCDSDEESECEESTKYINASYITGYWGTRAIIAAQGPLTNTLHDFWQMIYQKRVKAIVTLSAPSQDNKETACSPYWEEKKQTYDDLEVELTNEKSFGSYTERCFEIRHTKRKDVKKVCQFHYEQWKETLPKETKGLLEMIDKIKNAFPDKKLDEQIKHDKSVSVLAHCSDGSQLTGTFCALWNLLESAHVEGVIDVFQTVKNLRKQRPSMVSSYEHYQFLYDVLASTVPVQNGQIKTANLQEDKVEIENELKTNVPEVKDTGKSEADPKEELTEKTKEDETTSNGPAAAPFTEVTLRIDE